MMLRVMGLLLLLNLFSLAAQGADPLAEVSYRRRPAYLNGEHVVGVWYLKPGDAISTGGGRAYATAKYADSTRVSVRINSRAVFQPGWIDLLSGGLDIDLVSNTKHVEQVETPAGILALKAITGTVDIVPPPKGVEDSQSVKFRMSAKMGAMTLFVAQAGQPGKSVVQVTIDKGDKADLEISQQGRAIAISVFKGQVSASIGGNATVAFPELAKATIACTEDGKSFQIASTRENLNLTDGAGKITTIDQGSSSDFALAPLAKETLLAKSRRGLTATTATAVPVPPKKVPVVVSGKLPQDHPYQRVLRNYMARLTEADLDPGVHEVTVVPEPTSREQQYQMWLLSLDRVPRIGRKRSAPSVSAPARLFMLDSIEGGEVVRRPPSWPEPLAWFANWDYAGNPYYGSKPLKRRAFVTAATLMMLVDHLQEHTPEVGVARSDWLAHHLVQFSYTYPLVSDVLPDEVQDAYKTGLRKLVRRMAAWGPVGESIGLDMAAAVGFYYAGEALEEDQVRKHAESYARRLFTDPEFFHPAGYFVSLGGYDASYNGKARYFANWLAIASGYEFTKEPLRRAYRLRGHLCLPEPDGNFYGPAHFNSRASKGAYHDQYEWAYRDFAGAMLTDEAAHLARLPSDEELDSAASMRVGETRHQLRENPGYAKPEEIVSHPWSFRPWPNSWSFPNVINYAQYHYRSDSYAHRVELEKKNSPLLKFPFQREGSFVRTFEGEFTVSKQADYGVVLHTGQIAAPTRPGIHRFSGPYGLGGGQLSAFWTPKTGSVILGRRGGMNFDRSFDRLDQWRQWPIHAISGVRTKGTIFTSARVRKPQVKEAINGTQAEVTVTGKIPTEMFDQGKCLEGPIAYERKFKILPDRLVVSTTVKALGQDNVAELYETIPVFLRDLSRQRKQAPTTIEFQSSGRWQAANEQYTEGVTAIRLNRFDGTVVIRFAQKRRVKLTSADWHDTYMSRAACRNIMIDLLENNDQPEVFYQAGVSYEILAE